MRSTTPLFAVEFRRCPGEFGYPRLIVHHNATGQERTLGGVTGIAKLVNTVPDIILRERFDWLITETVTPRQNDPVLCMMGRTEAGIPILREGIISLLKPSGYGHVKFARPGDTGVELTSDEIFASRVNYLIREALNAQGKRYDDR